MADWIKLEKHTPEKPEVLRLARLLGVSRDDAFGKAVRFWLWLDGVSVDGRVDGLASTDVDAVIGTAGFSSAMKEVGWMAFDDHEGSITVPNFSRHNGVSAKGRASKARRQANWRGGNVDYRVDGGVDAYVDTVVTKEGLPDKIRIYTPPIVPPKGEKRTPKKAKTFNPPSVEDVQMYCEERGNNVNPAGFCDFYASKDWMVGKNKMKDWQAAVRTWERNEEAKGSGAPDGFDWANARILTDDDFKDPEAANG
jgi:hypothetical protein